MSICDSCAVCWSCYGNVMWYVEQEYLFFPAKSRFTFKGVEKDDADRLEARSNEVVQRDLDLNRIRPGFGAPGAIFTHFDITSIHCSPTDCYKPN